MQYNKLKKCRICGVLREDMSNKSCAICGENDFTEVYFCDRHHAELTGGKCPYCENERCNGSGNSTIPQKTISKPAPSQEPPPIQFSGPTPSPRPDSKRTTTPSQFPSPSPRPDPKRATTPSQQSKQESSKKKGCCGCLIAIAAIIILCWIIAAIAN